MAVIDEIKKSRRDLLILLLILLFGFLLRMAFLHEPFERDEGLYGYIGQEILRGAIPYRDVADLKPPGVFYIYAAIIATFGNTAEAVRTATALYAGLSTSAVFLLGKYLHGARAGLVAAFLFALFSPAPLLQGSSSNTEVFMLLPLVMSVYFLLRAIDSGRPLHAVLAGFAAGAALVIKTVALPFVLLSVLFIIFRPGLKTELRHRLFQLLWFCVPIVVMAGGVAAYFAAHGALDEMYYWNVTIHKTYVNRDGADFFAKMATTLKYLLGEQILLWVAGMAGGLAAVFCRRDRNSIYIALLLVVAFIGVAMPGHFFNHYFIILVPFCAVAAGGTRYLLDRNRAFVYIVAGAACVGLLAHGIEDYKYYLVYTPEQVSTFKYGRPTFAQSVGIAEYVKARTLPEDYIIQWGFEQEVLFLANRRSLPGLHCFLNIEWAPERQQALRSMLDGVNTKKPKYILLQSEDNFYVTNAFGFKELGEIIQRDYYPELEQGWAVLYRRKNGV